MSTISVIIPTYNAIAYLPDAIHSVLHQTYTDYEVIVVNDGSTDRTTQWVSQLSDARVRLISQPNQGKSAARNVGIQAAQSPYIAFLDADDLWESTKLEQQLAYMETYPDVGVVYTWTALADPTGQVTGRCITPTDAGNVWTALVQSNILTCGSTPLIRTECFEHVGVFERDLSLSQDWNMWIRLAARYPFGVIQAPLVRYRQHDGNTSMNWRNMQVCNTRVLERAFQTAPDKTLDGKGAIVTDIKGNAFNSLFLYLGWLAFRNAEYDESLELWRKAHQAAPQKLFSAESIRLRLSIALGQILGQSIYQKLSQSIYQVRRKILS